MQDGTKHIYHSIDIESPGHVTIPRKSGCCAGGRKALTLLLASALLWVIVLDILLVIYKSHRIIGVSVQKGGPASPPSDIGAMLRSGVTPSAAGGGNSTFSTLPPPPSNATERVGVKRPGTVETKRGEGQMRQGVGETKQRTGRDGAEGKSVAELPDLHNWLSRLRQKHNMDVTSVEHWRRPEQSVGHRLWPVGVGPPDNALLRRELGFPANKPHLYHQPGWLPGKPVIKNLRFMTPGLGSRRPFAPGFGSQGLPTPGHGSPTFGNRKLGGQEHTSGDETTADFDSAFLVRFFGAFMDAPWNQTSNEDEQRRHAPPLPLPAPPSPPFLPGRFINFPGHPKLDSIINADDKDDSEEAIFDIDIADKEMTIDQEHIE